MLPAADDIHVYVNAYNQIYHDDIPQNTILEQGMYPLYPNKSTQLNMSNNSK